MGASLTPRSELTLGSGLIAFGGLSSIGAKAGDTLLCMPSLGTCGAASIKVGLALGCNVIAAARNEEKLQELAKELNAGSSLKIVVLTGDGALFSRDFKNG